MLSIRRNGSTSFLGVIWGIGAWKGMAAGTIDKSNEELLDGLVLRFFRDLPRSPNTIGVGCGVAEITSSSSASSALLLVEPTELKDTFRMGTLNSSFDDDGESVFRRLLPVEHSLHNFSAHF